MLTNNLDMLKKARAGHYAIPAINTQGGTYDIIWAICQAAEEMNSPIILAHYVSTGAYSGHDFFVEVAKWCANKVSVPVSIHLDHGESFDRCMEALKLGFTSVMLDKSTLSIEENAKESNEVIRVAKNFNVPVEVEVGELQRLEQGQVLENKNLANPEEVKHFLELCQPDTLAIGIGNAHGFYTGEPDIHLEILDQVNEFCDLPFVLHGTSGLDPEIVKEAIKRGVAKVNYGTEVRYKYMEYMKDILNNYPHDHHAWKASQEASNRLKEDIKNIIRLTGSENKA